MRQLIVAKWKIAESDECIALAEPAFLHLRSCLQTGYSSFEAGGPIFAVRDGRTHMIVGAAGPFLGDVRRRHFFKPRRSKTQAEIDRRHKLGEHFIGTWHSHPEESPSPSAMDLKTMSTIYQSSKHDLRAMLMLIIGKRADPATWHASLHDGHSFERLSLVEG